MKLWKQKSNRLEFLEKNLKPIAPNSKVWDFCCGTGMNGITALEYGAKHTTFTDVRQQTFNDWLETDQSVANDNNHIWKFFDANELYESSKNIDLQDIDIIIYHGHFYHANNHYDIVKMLSKTSAKHILFETKGMGDNSLTSQWNLEPTDSKWNTWINDFQTHTPTGSPSWGLCNMLFNHCGWKTSDLLQQTWDFDGLPSNDSNPKMCQSRAYFTR